MALINCRECGKQISDEAINCVHCGCPVKKEEKPHCIECGKELENNENVCLSCGCPNELQKTNNENEENENIANKEIFIILVGVILLIIIIIICIIFSNNHNNQEKGVVGTYKANSLYTYVLDLYKDNTCYFENDSSINTNCTYIKNSNNEIIITYSNTYSNFSNPITKYTKFEILESGDLADGDRIYYKQ